MCEICWRQKKNLKTYMGNNICERCMSKELKYSRGGSTV